MSERQFPTDEVARRGRELYERSIREKVETDENIGKLVCIDIETGDYEVGDEHGIEASRNLRARHPDAEIWAERIGYDAAYTFGGTLTRTSRK